MWYGSYMNADRYIASLGLEAYRVGGSVRDELLNRKPKDADYVVRNASIAEVKAALEANVGAKATPLKLRDGRQVGWRAGLRDAGLVEIALPRTEVSTGPGRQDFEIVVQPGLGLEEDAKRRDFTINALYRNVHTREVVDPLCRGRNDLKTRLIKTTHFDSFRDDPLRTLRALRFMATLKGFTLASSTEVEMSTHASAVTGLTQKGVSGTALTELKKLLMGRNVAAALRCARNTGVLATLLPELEPMLGYEQESAYHDMTTDEHTFEALDRAAKLHTDLRVRMALLFHDSGKPDVAWVDDEGHKRYYALSPAEAVERGAGPGSLEPHEVAGARRARTALKRLNTEKSLMKDVETLILRHMVSLSGKTKASKVRRWRVELGDALLRDLFMHRLADICGKGNIDGEAVQALARLERIREEAQRRHVPTMRKELEVGGEDAKALGLEGPQIGKALDGVLHEVVSQPDTLRLSREWQLAALERLGKKAK
jgi:tRNA nucleotidyltransferase (CCA-adding enzyme)